MAKTSKMRATPGASGNVSVGAEMNWLPSSMERFGRW